MKDNYEADMRKVTSIRAIISQLCVILGQFWVLGEDMSCEAGQRWGGARLRTVMHYTKHNSDRMPFIGASIRLLRRDGRNTRGGGQVSQEDAAANRSIAELVLTRVRRISEGVEHRVGLN